MGQHGKKWRGLKILIVPAAAIGLIIGMADEGSKTASTASDKTAPVAATKYHGTGNKTFKVDLGDEPVIVKFVHKGTSNFIVRTLTADGSDGEFLVNEIGSVKGTVLANDESREPVAVRVQASGRWAIHLASAEAARSWNGESIRGEGPDVLKLGSGFTPGAVAAGHAGKENFQIAAVGGLVPELLVNEVGKYHGQIKIPDGPELIEIQADGPWSLVKK